VFIKTTLSANDLYSYSVSVISDHKQQLNITVVGYYSAKWEGLQH